MSKAVVGGVAAVVAGLVCLAAQAGWIVDGEAEESGGGTNVVVVSTNCTVFSADMGGTSVVYAVTQDGHTNVVGRFKSE